MGLGASQLFFMSAFVPAPYLKSPGSTSGVADPSPKSRVILALLRSGYPRDPRGVKWVDKKHSISEKKWQ